MKNNLPIIFIPGLGTSPRSYSGIFPALWKCGPVIIANQMYGNSIEAFAKNILDYSPQQFVLMGHSLGGYIAFEIMRQAPDRVLKLALLNTSARADNEEAKIKRVEKIKKAKQGKFPEIIEGALSAFVHPSHKDDKRLQEIITAAHNDAGVEAYINQQTAIMGRKDSLNDLKNIHIPTLVISGDDDKLIPIEHSNEIVDGIEGAKLVVINSSGHMSALEQPEEVSKALEKWLEE